MSDSPSDILPRQSLVLFHAEPDAVRRAYETVTEPFGSDIPVFDAKVRQLLDSVEAASSSGRLFFHAPLNTITGSRGLIVAMGLEGEATTVLAELLTESPRELNDVAKNRFECLGWSASRSELSAIIHADEPRGSRVAFAALVSQEADTFAFKYLARLLITESEISQWNACHSTPTDDVDFTFQPIDYWDMSNVRQSVLTRIKGEARRNLVETAAEDGILSDLPDGFLDSGLRDEDRMAIGRIDPSFMGGEYLPDVHADEVEIARIVFDSAGQDVISIRAVRRGTSIHYRVVDEYENTFRIEPATSVRPLTLRELINLIDTCEIVNDNARGLVHFYLVEQNSGPWHGPQGRRELRHFIKVCSEFYQGLQEYYEQQIERWTETGEWTGQA